jgi:hypothetical protein
MNTFMLNLESEFPIDSQTSSNDKIALLNIREVLQSFGNYSYLEIGSFLGGSLTPFIKDPNCIRILSIDDRGRAQSDERGINFDYAGITNESMFMALGNAGLSVEKIQAFDGSADQFIDDQTRYDFIFIDGEHTDFACFRDFIHTERLRSKNSIVAFHDSTLIYKSIKIILELLRAQNKVFTFIKVRDSEVSLIAFNEFSKLNLWQHVQIEKDLELFYKNSETHVLLSSALNRISINLSVKDTPTIKAY